MTHKSITCLFVCAVIGFCGCKPRSCDIVVPNSFAGGIVVIEDPLAGTLPSHGSQQMLTVPPNGVVRVRTTPFVGAITLNARRADGTPLIVTTRPYDDFRRDVGFRVCGRECGDKVRCRDQFFVGTAAELESYDFNATFSSEIEMPRERK